MVIVMMMEVEAGARLVEVLVTTVMVVVGPRAKTNMVDVERSCVSVWRTFLHSMGPSSVILWYPVEVFSHILWSVVVVVTTGTEVVVVWTDRTRRSRSCHADGSHRT